MKSNVCTSILRIIRLQCTKQAIQFSLLLYILLWDFNDKMYQSTDGLSTKSPKKYHILYLSSLLYISYSSWVHQFDYSAAIPDLNGRKPIKEKK